MKNLISLLFLFLLLGPAATAQNGECTFGGCSNFTSQHPPNTLSTTSSSFVTVSSTMKAGNIAIFNVTAGNIYEWSLCSADGGVSSYDSQLTLMDEFANFICYSDDYCGANAKIRWTATSSGLVGVLLSEYNCLSNNINTTLRWRMASGSAGNFDAAVDQIYSVGTKTHTNSNPHTITARIRNAGTQHILDLPVTLNVIGSAFAYDVQTISTLAPGASANVTFAGYVSTSTGSNNITVSVPSDLNNSNNSQSLTQLVTTNRIEYSYGSTFSGVGIPANTGEMAVKFKSNGNANISQIRVSFQQPGHPFQLKILPATGTGSSPGSSPLFTSSVLTSVAGLNTINVAPNVSVSGDFYIAIVQTATTSFVMSHEDENPVRTSAYYFRIPANSGNWNDFALANNNFRLAMGVVFGCTSPAQPQEIWGDEEVCAGQNYTYSVSTVAGATSYTWTLPSGWSGSSSSSTINVVAGSNPGIIGVTANNSCGTSSQSTLLVTASSIQLPTPNPISGNAIACSGSTQIYSIPTVAGALYYDWNFPFDWSVMGWGDTIVQVIPYSSGTVSVSAINNCGSGPSRTLYVNVETSLPAPVFNQAPQLVCQNNQYVYSVSPVAGAVNYTWYLPVGWVGSSNSSSITVTPGANNDIIRVAANGSCGPGLEANVYISVMTGPTPPVINKINNVLGSSYATGNQWYINGTIINGETSQFLEATQSGSYTVSFTNPQGCIAFSDSVYVTMVSIHESDVQEHIHFYPNPVSDNLSIYGIPNGIKMLSLKLYDVSGRILTNESYTGTISNPVVIEMKYLVPGVYYLKIDDGVSSTFKKIIKN